MTDLPDFTKKTCPPNSELVDIHRSAHEILRRAIDVAAPDEQIVLSIETAMGLTMEWKDAAACYAGVLKLLETVKQERDELESYIPCQKAFGVGICGYPKDSETHQPGYALYHPFVPLRERVND